MPNIALLLVVIFTVLGLCAHSSKHNEEQSRAQIAAMEHPPEHAAPDNSVSGGVWFFCFLLMLGGLYLAFPH